MPAGPTDHHRLEVDRSVALEQAELARRGIEDAPALFAYHYRCTFPRCASASLFVGHLRVAPSVRDGAPVCPLCGHVVERAGPRPRSVEVKVHCGTEERARLVVEEGEELTLGRRGGVGAIALDDLVGGAAERVSRRHLALALTPGGGLLVRDLGSKNGTAVLRPPVEPTVPGPASSPRRLPGNEWVDVGPDEVVLLPGRVWLVRSRRRYPVLGRQRPADPDPTVGQETRGTGGGAG